VLANSILNRFNFDKTKTKV